jgi:hypothetical protein
MIEDVDTVLPTIHWMDERIAELNEDKASPITDQVPAIAEDKAPYQATDFGSDNEEAR